MKVVVFLLVFACCFHQICSFQRSIVVLKAYKNGSVSDYRCIYLSKTSRLDPFLQTTKLKLVNLVSPSSSNNGLDLSGLLPMPPISVSILWDNFQDSDIIQLNPKLLVIIYNGELKMKFKMLTASHAADVFNRSVIFLDADQFNDIILSKSSAITDDIFLSVSPFTNSSIAYEILIWVLLYGFVTTAIILAAWMIVVNCDEMLLEFTQRYSGLPKTGICSYLIIVVFLLVAVMALVISYFFYDIIVYILITVFVLMGTYSIAYFLVFITQRFIPSINKMITCDSKLCRILGVRKVPVLFLVALPIALSITITWLVFRKDEMIGWPLQSVIGLLLVSTILSGSLVVPSVKVGTLLFVGFLIYDVFFVFITPLFSSHSSTDVNTHPNVEQVRRRRSNIDSYMEAVATGTAGKSGEILPLSFRLLINEYIQVNSYVSDTLPHSSLLGFGDAVIPGLFLMFLVFYDACWRISYYRHFVGGYIGYSIGFVIAITVLNVTSGSQPALLYLCPCTFFITFLTVITFDGLNEWKKLWSGKLPSIVGRNNTLYRGDEDGDNNNANNSQNNDIDNISINSDNRRNNNNNNNNPGANEHSVNYLKVNEYHFNHLSNQSLNNSKNFLVIES
uniref:Signal peptide peptidase-like 2A n=1 Tax=Trichobilharzia regenti TaxID=157069 RepID=A0AA85JW73_TRIRE|nr:unnamed protein product [Trichobilharzia regenti]